MLKVMGNGKLILVRHGQSEWNKSNQFTGWVDVDLTEQGERGKVLNPGGTYLDPEAAAAGAAAVANQGKK